MDLRYTPAEQQFRAELRAWLDDVLPSLPSKPDPDDWPARREYARQLARLRAKDEWRQP